VVAFDLRGALADAQFPSLAMAEVLVVTGLAEAVELTA
jgi:hypothetical protein